MVFSKPALQDHLNSLFSLTTINAEVGPISPDVKIRTLSHQAPVQSAVICGGVSDVQKVSIAVVSDWPVVLQGGVTPVDGGVIGMVEDISGGTPRQLFKPLNA